MDPSKESVKVPRPTPSSGSAPSSRRDPPPRATALDSTTPADVQRAIDEVVASAESLYRIANGFLGRQIEERPYAVIGAAAALGFVLGGGLTSRIGGVLATVGSRTLLSRFLGGMTASSEVRPPPWD